MSETECPRKPLVGLTIRTRNEDEMSSDTGKIAGLWQTFYQNVFPQLTPDSTVYGVYSNYESDHTGYFDVSAAVEQASVAGELRDSAPLAIQAGRYLKFTPENTSDDQVAQIVAMWHSVWGHFAAEDGPFQRAYTTDFEVYYPDQSVELYIAVK